MTLRVFDEDGSRVEAHRLVVEYRGDKGSEVVELEPRTRIGNLLSALSSLHIGIHHLADDGTGADDRNLHHKVIELVGVLRGSEAICALDST